MPQVIHRRTAVLALLLLLILSNTATWAIATGRVPYLDRLGLVPMGQVPPDLDSPAWRQLFAVLRLIRQNYVDAEAAADTTRLVEGATKGLVEALGDPYSYYMDAAVTEEMRIETEGTYAGVGMQIEPKGGYVVVVAPFDGTPADRAGLREGDRIIEVDGVSVVGMPAETVAAKIRGPAGTQVRLKINRPGRDEPFEVTIERAVIEIPTVSSRVFETGAGPVGYLRLMMFNERTLAQFREHWDRILAARPKGLILDLRGNPGGLLNVAVEVAGYFVPEGPVVRVVDRNEAVETLSARGRGTDLPLVVLINEFSASASEIVAGAIRDRGAGTLVGTKTFGKASVQQIWDLDYIGAETAVRITTKKYQTPNGHDIRGKGIEPDIVVENAPVEPDAPRIKLDDADDPRNVQLRKALEVLAEKIRSG